MDSIPEQTTPIRLPLTFASLPYDLLIDIFCEIDGDTATIRALACTCKRFRNVLIEKERVIATTIALKCQGITRILLDATAPFMTGKNECSKCLNLDLAARQPALILLPSLAWLGSACTRGHRIERLVKILEDFRVYESNSAFGRPLQRPDFPHARRMLLTVFLAIELCAMTNSSWSEKRFWLRYCAPPWAVDFAYRGPYFVDYLVRHFQLFVRDWNQVKDIKLEPAFRLAEVLPGSSQLTVELSEGMLISGASALADILCHPCGLRCYLDFQSFKSIAKTRLYGPYTDHSSRFEWITYPLAYRSMLLYHLSTAAILHEETRNLWPRPGGPDPYGVLKNNIDEWKSAIPDDEAWSCFLREHRWIRRGRVEARMRPHCELHYGDDEAGV